MKWKFSKMPKRKDPGRPPVTSRRQLTVWQTLVDRINDLRKSVTEDDEITCELEEGKTECLNERVIRACREMMAELGDKDYPSRFDDEKDIRAKNIEARILDLEDAVRIRIFKRKEAERIMDKKQTFSLGFGDKMVRKGDTPDLVDAANKMGVFEPLQTGFKATEKRENDETEK